MSDQNQTLRDDIAFMRTLAEEGQTGSLAGGSIMLAAGVIFAVASFVAAYGVAQGPSLNPLFFPIVWFGAAGLFFVALFLLRARLPPPAGVRRAGSVVWSGAGWSIFSIVLSLMLMSGRSNAWWLMAAVVPVILSIYGGAWFVGAVLSKMRWLYAMAFGSFVMAGVTAWFAMDQVTLFEVYGVSLLALMALPGFILMRQSKSA